MAVTISYLPCKVRPSSRRGKSGKITPARPSNHTQVRLSPPQVTERLIHSHERLSELRLTATRPQPPRNSMRGFEGREPLHTRKA